MTTAREQALGELQSKLTEYETLKQESRVLSERLEVQQSEHAKAVSELESKLSDQHSAHEAALLTGHENMAKLTSSLEAAQASLTEQA